VLFHFVYLVHILILSPFAASSFLPDFRMSGLDSRSCHKVEIIVRRINVQADASWLIPTAFPCDRGAVSVGTDGFHHFGLDMRCL
jgi:hypothetical protein